MRIPDGSRIIKCRGEEGDGHKIGDLGTVLSSIAVPDDMKGRPECQGPLGTVEYAYFVSFDEPPLAGVPIGILDWKITTAPE